MRDTTLILRRLNLVPDVFDLAGGGSPIQADFEVLAVDNTNLTVQIRGGFVTSFSGYAEVAAATVTVGGTSAAPHWIYASGSVSTPTGAIAASSAASFPTHGTGQDGPWRMPLYQVWIQDGAIRLRRIHAIDLRSWYGP